MAMRHAFVVDIDNTLTPPRRPLEEDMAQVLNMSDGAPIRPNRRHVVRSYAQIIGHMATAPCCTKRRLVAGGHGFDALLHDLQGLYLIGWQSLAQMVLNQVHVTPVVPNQTETLIGLVKQILRDCQVNESGIDVLVTEISR